MSARPFTESEFSLLTSHFAAAGNTRNLLLLKLGCGTSYRISELLDLRVRDVWTCPEVAKELTIARRNLKGGRGAYHRSIRGRRVPLCRIGERGDSGAPGEDRDGQARPGALFSTKQAQGEPRDRSAVYRVLTEACRRCGIDPTRISTHSLRKTFVGRIYKASSHDLIATQRIVGHTGPATTARYLETDSAQLDALMLSVAA
jgi:integrase